MLLIQREGDYALPQMKKTRNQEGTQKMSLRSLSGLPWVLHITLSTEVTQNTSEEWDRQSCRVKMYTHLEVKGMKDHGTILTFYNFG